MNSRWFTFLAFNYLNGSDEPNKKKVSEDYFIPLVHPLTGKGYPVPERGGATLNSPATMQELLKSGLIIIDLGGKTQPTRKYRLKDNLFENIPSLLYYGRSDDALHADLNILYQITWSQRVRSSCQATSMNYPP